ncbi:hypothetical protein Tco_1555625 [Tanacetum coccineum]
MSTANQQTLAESRASDRPPILEKGSYVPWASRFLRFLDNKKKEGELMRHSVEQNDHKKNQHFADITVMNYNLQGIPNDIYNSVDACPDAKKIWVKIKRLMQGSEISQQERHSRLMNKFDKFVAVEGESLTSVYERNAGGRTSKPTHGSIIDITYMMHAIPLGVSEAGTSFNGQKQQRIDLNADVLYTANQENLRVWLLKMLISKKPVPEWFHKR